MTASYDYEADANREDEAEHLFDPANEIEMGQRRPGPKSTLAVRMDGVTIDQLRDLAARRGVGVTQLARQWITERLAAESPDQPAPAAALEKVIADLTQVAAGLRSAS